jgi:response regulator RpfG family c-di-GMP phosphodiesterase
MKAKYMPAESNTAMRTVMICDDEVDILRVYSNFLRKKFNVITAESGESCLNLYSQERKNGKKIDVLLLDYRLGDMLGDAVACKIREMDGTKTILITAFEIDEKIMDDLKQRNCIALRLKKPVSLLTLSDKIQELAGGN